MSKRGLDVLWEDEAVLAVAKWSGLPTQAPREFDSLEAQIRRYLAGPHGDAAGVYLGIPHRLDRPASGAIVFAKTRRAARQLSRQFEQRRVRKIYWVCVERIVEPASGTWIDYLHKIYGRPQTEVVDHAHPAAQEATLHYRTLGYHAAGSWLEIDLATGRTHQIRVQSASRGYPLLGDRQYGGTLAFGSPQEDPRQSAIALHARELVFLHPTTKVETRVEAPAGSNWDALQLAPFGPG